MASSGAGSSNRIAHRPRTRCRTDSRPTDGSAATARRHRADSRTSPLSTARWLRISPVTVRIPDSPGLPATHSALHGQSNTMSRGSFATADAAQATKARHQARHRAGLSRIAHLVRLREQVVGLAEVPASHKDSIVDAVLRYFCHRYAIRALSDSRRAKRPPRITGTCLAPLPFPCPCHHLLCAQKPKPTQQTEPQTAAIPKRRQPSGTPMNWWNTIETATETSQILAHCKPRRSGARFSSVIARSRSRRSLRRSRRTADRAQETDDLTLPITGSAFAIRQSLPRAHRQTRQVARLRLHQIHHENGLFTIDLQTPPISSLANCPLQAIVSVFQL